MPTSLKMFQEYACINSLQSESEHGSEVDLRKKKRRVKEEKFYSEIACKKVHPSRNQSSLVWFLICNDNGKNKQELILSGELS